MTRKKTRVDRKDKWIVWLDGDLREPIKRRADKERRDIQAVVNRMVRSAARMMKVEGVE